jgi:hypothetical protein
MDWWALNKETSKCKALPTNMFGEYHDYHLGVLENDIVSGRYMQNLKHNKNLGGTQGSKHSRPLFMGGIIFMQAINKRDAFLVYIFFGT